MKVKRASKTKYSTVSLPAPLVEKIKKTIKNTGYVSVSDFVTDVLRTVLVVKSAKRVKNFKNKKEDDAFSDADNELIKSRLKALGYI